jgi:ADP-heptose:LPS heptosyltransferase
VFDIVLPIKRKFFSAIWRFKQATIKCYHSAVKSIVKGLTEKHWLLDYLPTFIKKKNGVLLIRLDLIGDFVLWLDSAQAYRRLYPHQKITLAVNSACADLAKALPHWDEVLSVDVNALRTNYAYRLLTLIKLRWRNFKVAIQPTFSRELVGDLVLRSTFASQRIGCAGDANNITLSSKAKTDSWYTKLVPNDPLQIMELNVNAHFVRELGCDDFLSRIPTIPRLATPIDAQRLTSPYIVVAPGASWQPKMWPAQNFAQVIKQLVAEFNVQVVLCGGKSDQPVCTALAKQMLPLQTIDLSGETTLSELVEIIRGAKLVLTNDSAPTHLAAATLTPSVCILGGGHFRRFLPYQPEQQCNAPLPTAIYDEMACFGCSWKCIYSVENSGAVPCISNISERAVYAACSQHLTPGLLSRGNN